MYFTRSKCRACGAGELVPVFDLGLQPLANDFKAATEEQAGYAPLKVMFCPKCTLSQLSVTVSPDILYANDYPYVTSKSDTMKAHFVSLWEHIRSECNPEVVVEIGSNDGDFLKFCKDNGAQHVVGIDPASNLAEVAKSKGIGTIRSVFDCESAKTAAMSVPQIDAIVARHVFCHADDWREFIKAIDLMAHKDTAIFIEVPYVMDMLERLEMDTLYHEHTSYLSIRSMLELLSGTPMRLYKVTRFTIHGGAIVMVLKRRDSGAMVDLSIDEFVLSESDLLAGWSKFDQGARAMISSLTGEVKGLVSSGATVVGFGASAKSTVWINACGFTKNHIRYICDCTPNKQGKLSPGTDIPIVDEARLLADQPDYAVLFCWNYLTECLKKQIEYRNRGGKFIIPVPKLEIV